MTANGRKRVANRIGFPVAIFIAFVAVLCRHIGISGIWPKGMGIIRGILRCVLIGS